jgi:hypothetical protein
MTATSAALALWAPYLCVNLRAIELTSVSILATTSAPYILGALSSQISSNTAKKKEQTNKQPHEFDQARGRR